MKWLFVSMLLLSFACTQKESAIVATVNGKEILSKDVSNMMELMSDNYDENLILNKTHREQLKRQALDRLLQEEILLNEVEQYAIHITMKEVTDSLTQKGLDIARIKQQFAEENRNYDIWLQQQQRRLMIQKLLEIHPESFSESALEKMRATAKIIIHEDVLGRIP